MIFLSAQPDDCVFLWQLEVFLESIKDFGYRKDQIHILIGYNPYKGPSAIVKEFLREKSSTASVFLYPDIRENKVYVSAIRPHIIKQHYAALPRMENETIFYHDSDIVFTKPLDIDILQSGKTWYVSDTKSYLNATYIKKCGDIILTEMCDIVGIERQLVEQNDDETGGAQYVIKDVNYAFWDKVEKDAEQLFRHLNGSRDRYAEDFSKITGKAASEYHPIQAWCSDMWAVLWNGYFAGHEIKIHPMMDFAWPTNPKENWDSLYIYHDAGITHEFSSTHFDKGKHRSSFPFFFDNSHADKEKCTARYAALIDKIGDVKRYAFEDTTFLIPLRIDSEDRINNINAVIKYLNKYLITNILVLEIDSVQKFSLENPVDNVTHIFIKDDAEVFNRTEVNNLLVSYCKTPLMAIYDTDVIISPDQLYQSIIALRHQEADIISPYDGDFLDVPENFRDIFYETIDIKKLNSNQKEFKFLAKYSWGGTIMMYKDIFEKIGKDNINLVGYGPEDYERIKRAEILGFKIKRSIGPLFHLRHERTVNSYYFNPEIEVSNKIELLKVCNMPKQELKAYVESW